MALTWGAAKIRLHRHRRLPPFAEGAKDGHPEFRNGRERARPKHGPMGPVENLVKSLSGIFLIKLLILWTK